MSIFDTLDADDFPTDNEPKQDGRSTGRGICSICGEPAYDGRAKKCELHKEVKDDTKPRAKKSKSGSANLKAQLEGTLFPLAYFWTMRDPICGQVALQQVPEIAEALSLQAAASPRLRKALEQVTSTGGWLGVLAAGMPIVVVAMQHHGPQRNQVSAPVEPTLIEQMQDQAETQTQYDEAV